MAQNSRGILFRVVPILIAIIIAAFTYFSSSKTTNELGREIRLGIAPEQESELGLQSYREVLAKYRRIESGPEFEMVRRVAGRVTKVVGKEGKDFQWDVSLVQEKQANAFCLPGGKIVVFSGILPLTKTEGGLAAVMGHEIAHATSHHGSERMAKTKATNILLQGVSVSLSDMSYESQRQVMTVLGAGAQYGLVLPWGRDQESEADHLGLLYMARAGYDPHEAVEFWQRMEKAGGKQGPEFASTHPSNETRIQQIKELLPKAMAEFEKAKSSGISELR